jgi:hypothetical protein
MSYKIFPTSKFEKELKRLVKKFPSLKSEYQRLIELLSQAPDLNRARLCLVRLIVRLPAATHNNGAKVDLIVLLFNSTMALRSKNPFYKYDNGVYWREAKE